jgi:hypothetical protein
MAHTKSVDLQEPAKLLLVDDNIASGHTYRQAIEYLGIKFPEWDNSFIPMFYRHDSNYKEIEQVIVWNNTK